jgi:hypothetical protein
MELYLFSPYTPSRCGKKRIYSYIKVLPAGVKWRHLLSGKMIKYGEDGWNLLPTSGICGDDAATVWRALIRRS